jgi:hypothetical protein
MYRDTPPSIDGDIRDWDVLSLRFLEPSFGARNWRGSGDQSGRFGVAWDFVYLYIVVQVEDDVHIQNQSGINIFKGDSVDLVLDTNLEEDFDSMNLNADDYQIGLSPGDLASAEVGTQAYLWYPRTESRALPEVLISSRSYEGAGFQLEAAIPWSVFDVNPKREMAFGFVLSSSDNDDPYAAVQQTMISAFSSRRLTDPTSWGTLILEEGRGF